MESGINVIKPKGKELYQAGKEYDSFRLDHPSIDQLIHQKCRM